MAIIKCKMCGGDLNIEAGMTVAECEYCGTRQTVPTADSEKKLTLFARAHRLRAACEFDKAAAVYESIVAEFPTEAEAYWGLVLCRYGIEYVDDPATGKKIPTCHRSSFESILEDSDFEQALENADAVSRKVYREEAKVIEDIRQRIVELSGKEQPYDIFICYKETDENGERTPDSVMAQEVYDALTEKGYRVFFSRLTLEDKLGTEYEPYIFAALNSAKIMLVFGTDYEYFNAVWVKNEWSRFLALMASGQKKSLIPCYKGVDAYDMPKEFSHLQGQDMGKLGAIQDLVRGVEKLLGNGAAAQPTKETVVVQAAGGASGDALLKRGNMALEDGSWAAAQDFFDRVLDMNAECAEAYLGKFLAGKREKGLMQYTASQVSRAKQQEKSVPKEAAQPDAARIGAAVERFTLPPYLSEREIRAQYAQPKPYSSVLEYWQEKASQSKEALENDRDLKRARSFAKGAFKEEMERNIDAFAGRWAECVRQAERRDEQAKDEARKAYEQAMDEGDSRSAALYEQAVERREKEYQLICKQQAEAKEDHHFRSTASKFDHLGNYKDCAERAKQCWEMAEQLQKQADAEKARQLAKKAAQRKRAVLIVAVIVIILAAAWYITQVFLPAQRYKAADRLYGEGQYSEAAQAFETLGDYQDSSTRALQARYAYAEKLLTDGDYDAAISAFAALGNYSDAARRIQAAHYAKAESLLAAGNNDGAIAEFEAAGDFEDAAERLQAIHYSKAEALLAAGDYAAAISAFEALGNYSDAAQRVYYTQAQALESAGDLNAAAIKYGFATGYADARERSFDLWAQITDRETVSAGSRHTVGLRSNGSVIAVGDNSNGQCNVQDWTDIVAVSVASRHTASLKSDGSVAAVGDNFYNQCNVQDWTDIVAVSAGTHHTIGLKSNGSVIAVGSNYYGQRDVENWTDIVAVTAGTNHTVGLKSDGTVIAVGNNDNGQCDVQDWTDIVAVSAGAKHTVGLKSDGTVVAVGNNNDGQCGVQDWTDIVAVTAGNYHTIGLKSDGSVVAVGDNAYGQCDIQDWTDIVAVTAGVRHTVGLKSDGSVVAVGYNAYGQCDIQDWTDIVAVTAGVRHTVGLKSDGSVVAVGDNGDGQCDVQGWTDIRVRQ